MSGEAAQGIPHFCARCGCSHAPNPSPVCPTCWERCPERARASERLHEWVYGTGPNPLFKVKPRDP